MTDPRCYEDEVASCAISNNLAVAFARSALDWTCAFRRSYWSCGHPTEAGSPLCSSRDDLPSLLAIDIARDPNVALIELPCRKCQRFRMTNREADFDRLLSYLQVLKAGTEVASINPVARTRYLEAML